MLDVAKDLRPDTIVCIGDLADFYCVTPETRVLTADLRWVHAGDVRVGDELLGYGEDTGDRTLRRATVLHDGLIRRNVYRITLKDGTVLRSSAEHPWLTTTGGPSKNIKWRTTEEIAQCWDLYKDRDGWRSPPQLLRYLKPWPTEQSRLGGYVAGVLDGEGHLCAHLSGLRLGYAQHQGVVLDAVNAAFDMHGVPYRVETQLISRVRNVYVAKGWAEKLRALGMYRPVRLLKKFSEALNAGKLGTLRTPEHLEIESIEYEGEQDVAALETSTHTYIAEGFGAHNSVSAHSKSPERAATLKEEVEYVRARVGELEALGAKDLLFCEGNHEHRLTRYLADKAPALFGTVDVQSILGLEKWEFIPYRKHSKRGKIHWTHDIGSAGRHAVYRALDIYQHSNVTGHTHRLAYVVEGNAVGECKVAASFGWLGDVEKVDYLHEVKAKTTWALGFGVGYLDKQTGHVHLQPVPIVDARCVVAGKLYKAPARRKRRPR